MKVNRQPQQKHKVTGKDRVKGRQGKSDRENEMSGREIGGKKGV